MEIFIEFIGNHYAWFLTITILLLFSLIGYIYDSKRNKTDLFKKTENEIEEISLEYLENSEGKSLSEVVSTSKNINSESINDLLTDEKTLEDKTNIES